MRRKLVKQGAATMMISLPAKWIKQNKLDKGDEIELEEKENSLVIGSKPRHEEVKQSIDVSNLSPMVNRTLISSYIKGVDELEVNFSNPREIEDFQKRVINELLGFEVIKQTQKSLIIKDITGSERQEVDDLIKRIFLILDSMAEELVIGVEKKHDLTPVIEIDSSINKFVNFTLRILNKKGYKEASKTSYIYGIVSMLEEIGDLYKKIAKIKKINSKQLAVIKELRVFLKMFEKLMFNFDKKLLVEFSKKYEEIKIKISQKDIVDFYLFSLNETIIKMNNYLLVCV